MKKLSKSTGAPTAFKAQVFKFRDSWLYACQEGCPNKYVPNASHALMFKIAESHMKTVHKDHLYDSVGIYPRT